MASPADFTNLVRNSLAITMNELLDLRRISKQNIETYQALDQALTKLDDVLSKLHAYESWTETEANLALKSLDGALVNTSSLVSKWKKGRILLMLNKSLFLDKLSDAIMEIQNSWVELQTSAQALQNHREEVLAIGEELNTVAQGLRAEEPGNIADAQLKEPLDFRLNHFKSKTFVTWLARNLDTDVHSIEQDLQEMKENADTHLNAQRDMGTELLEQLILSLYELEKQSGTPASTKVICTLCNSQMVACLGEAEEQPAAESFIEDGESSDASWFHRDLSDYHVADESLDRKAELGLKNLDSPDEILAPKGFRILIKCASSPGGRLAVFNAKYTRPPPAAPAPPIKVIPTVMEKVKTQDLTYAYLAVKLMAALTSSKGGASQNSGEPESRITLEADALNFIVSLLNEERFSKTRLLAAETLANISENREERNFFLRKEGIVPSLVVLSKADIVSHEDKEKVSAIGLKGLQHLAKEKDCIGYDKTMKIVSALIKLLKKGLSDQPKYIILVRDSLIALDNQVLAMDHGALTSEACEVVWKEMKGLLAIEGVLVSHVSVPGRMAIIKIMTKLCGLYNDDINEYVFLYLLKMIKYTRFKIESLSEPSSQSILPQDGIKAETLKNLTELVNRCISLLCFCVSHGKSTAQSVLSKNIDEGRTLEELFVHGETLGISDESRLEILSILEQIDIHCTQTITILVKTSESKDQNCRQQVARKLRALVEGKQHFAEFIQAESITALLTLLNDPSLNCRQDALVALQALTSSIALPVDKLPLESILYFLIQKGPDDVTNAAIVLFDLMVEGKVVSAVNFLESKGAFEAILRLLDTDSDSLGSQKSATALLVMAKEDQSIRTRIAEHGPRGLHVLVKYASTFGNEKVKELLTATLVLFCRGDETYQKAVIEADGHRFLITCLQERISKEEAARGLLELIENTRTIEVVLNCGFVAAAMGSIDRMFTCLDIARGLSHISSICEGLNQIYSDNSSVSALLILLEHCPETVGKNAAALIISRLYPLLRREEDSVRREEDSTRRERIIDKCQLLLDNLDPFEPDLVNGFLEALAALAAEPEGRKMIHQTKGLRTLSNHFSGTDTEIQGLLLKILSEMSSDNGVETHAAKMISNKFMDIEVGEKVFMLLRSSEFCRRTESMKDALILIRNLSLAASYASSKLVQEGAVSALLEVLQQHEELSPIVTELALKALEKVLDDPKGKATFISGGGIKSLVAIIKMDAPEKAGDACERGNVATIILMKVAGDSHCRKLHAIGSIFEGNILPALNRIIFYGQPDKLKWQAVVLIKLLAKYGPSKVFIAIKEKDCLDALIFVLSVPDCTPAAQDVLDFLSEKNKACKIYIQDRNNEIFQRPRR